MIPTYFSPVLCNGRNPSIINNFHLRTTVLYLDIYDKNNPVNKGIWKKKYYKIQAEYSST